MISQNHSFASHWMEHYWNENGDPRVAHYPLMSSFRPALSIFTAYAVFVQVLGPRWMSNRKAYSLKTTLLVFNFIMALANGYFFCQIRLNYREAYNRMVDVSFPRLDLNDPLESEVVFKNYLYMCSKYVDLLDTVFFVLRKKQSQITGLDFYHHLSVPSWTYYRLCGVCHNLIPFGTMNTFIHTVMYSYYGLSALGPHVHRYLWWKRYLTQLQIVQFILLFVYEIYFAMAQQNYSQLYIWNHLIQTGLYIVLFTRFYLNAYRHTDKTE